eukprot:686875_1
MSICIQSAFFMFVWMLCTIPTTALLSWTQSTSAISEIGSLQMAAIAVYNDSAWIFGGGVRGTNAADRILQINVGSDTVTEHTNSVTIGDFFSQSYCQVGSFLFTSYDWDSFIQVYDLHSQSFMDQITHSTLTNGEYYCITATNDYLFRIGGSDGSALDVFYIYNLNTTQFSIGPPMNETRDDCACSIVKKTLYVIGGGDGNNNLRDSVHFIDISNPLNNPSWSPFPGSLSVARQTLRSVVYEHLIYAVGGWDELSYSATVDVIDTVHETISYDSSMAHAQAYSSVAIIKGILYSFGGSPTTSNEHYQYAPIPPFAPTASPTNAGTQPPTSAPSTAPTQPTRLPSTAPTQPPSRSPSLSRTASSVYPAVNSSMNIEVTVKQTNERDDSEPTEKNESINWLIAVVIVALLLCAVLTLIYCHYTKQRRKRVQNNQNMVQKELGTEQNKNIKLEVFEWLRNAVQATSKGCVDVELTMGGSAKMTSDNNVAFESEGAQKRAVLPYTNEGQGESGDIRGTATQD